MTLAKPTLKEKEIYFALKQIHEATKQYVFDSTELGVFPMGLESTTAFYMNGKEFSATQQIAKIMLDEMLELDLITSATALCAFIAYTEQAWKLDSLFRFVFDDESKEKWSEIFDESMKILDDNLNILEEAK